MQVFLSIIVSVLTISLHGVSGRHVISPKWVPSKDVIRSDLFPAGVESGRPYYIGRASMYGGQIPGKVLDDQTNIWFGFNGKENSKDEFDLLVYPRGSLTWVEVVAIDNVTCLPDNIFVGGVDPRDEGIFYICRAWHHNNLVVGKLPKKTGLCEVALFGTDHEKDMFDVLTENKLGPCLNSQEEYTGASGIFAGISIFLVVLTVCIGLIYLFRRYRTTQNYNKVIIRAQPDSEKCEYVEDSVVQSL